MENTEQIFEMATVDGKQTIIKKAKRRILDYSNYFLTYDESKRLKEACLSYEDKSNIYFTLISLMLNCGMRRTEAVNLKIEQINLNDRMIELGTDTKTGMPRKIPFNDELKRSMLILIGNKTNGYLFLHRSKNYSEKRYSTMQVNNIVAMLGKKANIAPKSENLKNINPHLLRHTWAKFCIKSGMDRNMIRVMGGWKSDKMLNLIYGVPDYESVRTEYHTKMNW